MTRSISLVATQSPININERSARGELGVMGQSLSLSFSSFLSTLALPSVTYAIQIETTGDESSPFYLPPLHTPYTK